MLSDPLGFTYNGVAKSLPRASGVFPGVAKKLGNSLYATSGGEFKVQTSYSQTGGKAGSQLHHAEIAMMRTVPDTDSDPFNNSDLQLANYVGLFFGANFLRYETAVDIPLLRTALLSLVDTTLQGRLIAGEM